MKDNFTLSKAVLATIEKSESEQITPLPENKFNTDHQRDHENISGAHQNNPDHFFIEIYSKVLERDISIEWSKSGDSVTRNIIIDECPYSPDEIAMLKNESRESLKGIHEVKSCFQGQLIEKR